MQQGEHTTLFHVTWRHMALLSQDQLYELANKLCVRLGNLQKVLPCYRSAHHDYTVMVLAQLPALSVGNGSCTK